LTIDVKLVSEHGQWAASQQPVQRQHTTDRDSFFMQRINAAQTFFSRAERSVQTREKSYTLRLQIQIQIY